MQSGDYEESKAIARMVTYRERERLRLKKRDAARVASGDEARRLRSRRARAAGLAPEDFVAEKARVARARSSQRRYKQHGSLRKAVNRERVAELAREVQRRLILAKYHADPDNWSTRRKRARIFERDGWRCRSCGRAVTDQVRMGAKNRAVAGHIVAAAKGGGWTAENIATLCHPCNVADGVERIPIQAHIAW